MKNKEKKIKMEGIRITKSHRQSTDDKICFGNIVGEANGNMGLDETAAKKTGYPTWKWLLKNAGSVCFLEVLKSYSGTVKRFEDRVDSRFGYDQLKIDVCG